MLINVNMASERTFCRSPPQFGPEQRLEYWPVCVRDKGSSDAEFWGRTHVQRGSLFIAACIYFLFCDFVQRRLSSIKESKAA
jgi:hypothetical protein